MNKRDMIYFGRYEGWLRHLAKGVRDNDDQCIQRAAMLFGMMLRDDCIVIPMPSHSGYAASMLRVAQYVSALYSANGNRMVLDLLYGDERESSYHQKKDGDFPVVEFKVDDAQVDRLMAYAGVYPVYVIDNVICTGATADAAVHALGKVGVDAKVCAIAYSQWKG